ncbi:hypothetical protein GRJ2_002924400 [Grus japonensis]|uniref:Uncharacterized protein n=1 Tax=Grus japonensis TaxID=30415 RepID=A0ABC9Y3G3_GRUJA
MEDPTPEQVEAPEGGCGPWEAHAGASSWPDRWTREEGSPCQGRFAGRTCDPVGDPTLEQFAPEGSTENKQEELETCTYLQGYDLIGIMETWWDGFYDWSVRMEGYRLFRKDRQGRRGGGVTLYVNDQLECMELHMGMDEEPTKSLWVRIKGRAGTGDTIVGVCYRPPDQED